MPGHGTLLVEDGTIVAQEQAGTAGCRLLTVRSPDVARVLAPGQFVMLRVTSRPFPYLGRPFSVADRDPRRPDTYTLAYVVRGEGTRALAAARAGDAVRTVGPLGNGFPTPRAPAYVFVAGGIGAAPFPLLARELTRREPGVLRIAYLGAATAAELHLAARLEALGVTVHRATEDGTAGRRGTVVDLLRALAPPPRAVLYGCGPPGMLRALGEWAAAHSRRCYASLEEHMACGFGACNGCVVPVAAPQGRRYALVCLEGPVLELGQVRWPTPEASAAAEERKCEVQT